MGTLGPKYLVYGHLDPLGKGPGTCHCGIRAYTAHIYHVSFRTSFLDDRASGPSGKHGLKAANVGRRDQKHSREY